MIDPQQYLEKLAMPEPRPDPEMIDRVRKLRAASDSGRVEAYTEMAPPGRVAVYRCGFCGGVTVTANRHGGMTPLLLKCRAHSTRRHPDRGCGEFALRTEEEAPKGAAPTHEWYIPARREIRRQKRAFPTLFSHVHGGGLILRPIPGALPPGTPP